MNKNKRLKARAYQGAEGEVLYSVATGVVNNLKKASREAVKVMCMQEGFKASHIVNGVGTLWFYDSENNAKGARNVARSFGIQCGDNICKFVFENGVLVCKTEQN